MTAEDNKEDGSDNLIEDSKEASGLQSFYAKMDDESILSILIESFGQWDTRDPAKHKLESDVWDKCVLYGWSAQGVFFIIGDMEDNQNRIWYSGKGILTKRSIQRIIKKIKGDDYGYHIRKILWSYVDQNKLKKYDSRAYIPIAIAGAVSAVLSLFGLISGYGLWVFIAAFISISSPIIWGFYRHATSVDAIDLRVLALAFQYIIVLQILPTVIIITGLGLFLYLPTTVTSVSHYILNHVAYIALMMAETILLNYLFNLLTSSWIVRKLLSFWSHIRKESDGSYDSTIDSFPSLPVKLGNLSIMQWYVARNTGIFVSHVFLIIIIAYRLFGIDYMFLGFMMVFLIFTWLILISEGRFRGFNYAARTIEGYGFILGEGYERYVWGIKKKAETERNY